MTRPTIALIQERAALHFGVPVEAMRTPDEVGQRVPKLAQARMTAMAVCDLLTDHTLATIGRHFGGRDHSTVIHARETVPVKLPGALRALTLDVMRPVVLP